VTTDPAPDAHQHGTLGLLLSVAVHPANIQDRGGVALVLDRRTRRLFPFIERIDKDMALATRDLLARIEALWVEQGPPFARPWRSGCR
jgi:hypothetical protein